MKTFPRFLILAACVCMLALCLRLRSVERNGRPKVGAAKAAAPAVRETSGVGESSRVTTASTSEGATASEPGGVNAADFYKDAYQLYQALSDREKYILRHPTEELDAKEAEAFFAKIQPIMELLRRAKNEGTYADWGISAPRFDTPVPQIQAAMELGSLARWNAAYRFDNDPAGALDDLQAQSMLAHSVGNQAMLGTLVAAALDAGAVDLIHDHLAELTPELMQQAAQLMRDDGRGEELTSALAAEAKALQATAEQMSDPAARRELLDAMAGMAGWTPEMLEAQLPTLKAQADWMAQAEQQFGSEMLRGSSEFAGWWASIQAQAKDRPFAALTIPALDGMHDRYVSVVVDRAMLTEGMSIMQGGPSMAGAVLDPSTGRPFTYVQTATGFELHSPFAYKNKPIVMTFGAPGK